MKKKGKLKNKKMKFIDKMKKKKKLNLLIAVLVVVLVAAFALIIYLQSPEKQAVTEETKYTYGNDLISDIKCVDGTALRFVLSNIEESALTIAEDVSFYLNTVPDRTPECGKSILMPGDSTECTLDAVELGFRPSVVVTTPENKDVRKVSC